MYKGLLIFGIMITPELDYQFHQAQAIFYLSLQLQELVEAKLAGGQAFTTAEAPAKLDDSEDVSDLLAKLEASVRRRREESAARSQTGSDTGSDSGSDSGPGAGPDPAPKKTPAKAAAKKAPAKAAAKATVKKAPAKATVKK